MCLPRECLQAALATFPAHELLLLLLGVAGTRRKPPPGWRQGAAAALQPALCRLSPAQLSTAVMAMAKLQHVPSTAWLQQFWQSWEAQQLQFSARSHASVMWAIGTIRPYKPDQNPWVKKLQAACQQAVAQATTAVAAVALQKIRLAAQRERLVQQEQLEQQQQQDAPAQQQQLGSANSGQGADQASQPPLQQQQSWEELQFDYVEQVELSAAEQQHLIQEQPQLLASASLLHPTDCAMVMYGLARLGRSCLDPSFPAFWLAQSRSQLVNMNSQELATCLWALGKLRLLPPEAWLQQHLQCSARMASVMSHKQLAMVWWGCAKLRVSEAACAVLWGSDWVRGQRFASGLKLGHRAAHSFRTASIPLCKHVNPTVCPSLTVLSCAAAAAAAVPAQCVGDS